MYGKMDVRWAAPGLLQRPLGLMRDIPPPLETIVGLPCAIAVMPGLQSVLRDARVSTPCLGMDDDEMCRRNAM